MVTPIEVTEQHYAVLKSMFHAEVTPLGAVDISGACKVPGRTATLIYPDSMEMFVVIELRGESAQTRKARFSREMITPRTGPGNGYDPFGRWASELGLKRQELCDLIIAHAPELPSA